MIYNTSVKTARDSVQKYLAQKKFPRVVDLGGAMNPWAKEYVTHYFDILSLHVYLQNSPLYTEKLRQSVAFVGDMNDGYGWEEIDRDVKEHGLFDFAICTQALEDIRNPVYVLRSLPRIAKQGFISVPHKYRELSYCEGWKPVDQEEWGLSKPYIGYCHHRWIFTVIDGSKLRLFPKLEFVSCIAKLQELIIDKPIENELSFWWRKDIPFEIVNDDYLGPNPPALFNMYIEKIEEGI